MVPDCKKCKNKNCFILNNFSPARISEISNQKKILRLKKGEYLYKKSSRPNCVYILLDGCLEIIKKDKNGGKKDFYFVEPGELFGYRSLICDEPHNTSAKVYKNSTVCKIERDDFFTLFANNHSLAKNFMKYISEQLTKREKKLEAKSKSK